jgi:hypothetical protein
MGNHLGLAVVRRGCLENASNVERRTANSELRSPRRPPFTTEMPRGGGRLRQWASGLRSHFGGVGLGVRRWEFGAPGAGLFPVCRRYLGLLAVCASVVACSLFEPRDAEAPSGGAALWEVPRSPATVIINMENSFVSRHVDFYMRCFDSTMTFEADPLAQSTYPGVFDNWGWIEEEAATRNLFADLSQAQPTDSLLALQMAVDLDDSDVGETDAQLEVDYLLEAWLASDPQNFQGGGAADAETHQG